MSRATRNCIPDRIRYDMLTLIKDWADANINKHIGFAELAQKLSDKFDTPVTESNAVGLAHTFELTEYFKSRGPAKTEHLEARVTDLENRCHAIEFAFNKLIDKLEQHFNPQD